MNVSGLYSSIFYTFIGLGIKEYNSDIFLGTEKFKTAEKYIMFFCSDQLFKMMEVKLRDTYFIG
jgi:hypothetical protein